MLLGEFYKVKVWQLGLELLAILLLVCSPFILAWLTWWLNRRLRKKRE